MRRHKLEKASAFGKKINQLIADKRKTSLDVTVYAFTTL